MGDASFFLLDCSTDDSMFDALSSWLLPVNFDVVVVVDRRCSRSQCHFLRSSRKFIDLGCEPASASCSSGHPDEYQLTFLPDIQPHKCRYPIRTFSCIYADIQFTSAGTFAEVDRFPLPGSVLLSQAASRFALQREAPIVKKEVVLRELEIGQGG